MSLEHIVTTGEVDDDSEGSSCSSDSDYLGTVVGGKRRAAISGRSRKRLKLLSDLESRGCLGGESLLEHIHVKPASKDTYQTVLRAFTNRCGVAHLDLRPQEKVDSCLAEHLNHLFCRGLDSSAGEKLMAAWMEKYPAYGRMGSKKTPRAWKCLRSWIRRNPKRSRKPKSWPVVAAVMCRLVARRRWWKALYLGLSWSGWLRPSEGLSLRYKDLIRPASGLSENWALLIAPSETGAVDKVGSQDNTVILDVPETLFMNRIYSELVEGKDMNDLIFEDLTYQDLYAEVRSIGEELNLPNLVLYALTRHSGPSWAMLKGRMDVPTAMKRGRWKTTASIQRYENAGRVTQEWNSYTPDQKAFFLTCGKAVGNVMLGEQLPPRWE